MADLALLLLTLTWGTTFTLVKRVLEAGTSPAVFLSLRFGVAVLAVGAAWAWVRPGRSPRLWRDGALLGLAMFAGFALQTLGLRYTTPARSGFITGLAVLVVPFIARFLLRRTVLLSSWAGVALAVAGLLLLTQPFGGTVTAAVRLGDALTLACAIAYAFQVAWTSELSPRHPLASLTLVQVGVTFLGSVAMLPLETVRLRPTPETWGTVLFTGLVMTAGAFFVMNWAQRHTTAVRAALIYALEPPAAALFSHWVTGERLDASGIAGGALIVLGVLAGELGGVVEARRRASA